MSDIRPVWHLTYEGVDVTDELAPMVLSAEYVDHLKGSSDELQITVEDRAGRWREGWFPSRGDRLTLKLGYDGEPLLDCGTFAVDEVEMRGPPDTVAIGALAAPLSPDLRNKVSRAFESTTLREIAERIARELGLELVGEVADIRIGRVTQTAETTLAFLRRVADEYGYAFSIRPPRLVFYEIARLEAAPAAVVIDRTKLLSYSLKGTTQETYVACELTFLDPATKELRKVTVYAPHARERVVLGSGSGTAELALPTRTLRQGMRGDDVRAWQSFLVSRGYDTGGLDGIFGPKTRSATMSFQRAAGITVDGIAGPETYRAALEAGYGSTATGTRAEISGRVLRIQERAESLEQAEAKAMAKLTEANRLRVTGSLSLRGNPRVVAGTTLELTGMGRVSGRFLVQKSTHRISRSGGYTTEVEVTCV